MCRKKKVKDNDGNGRDLVGVMPNPNKANRKQSTQQLVVAMGLNQRKGSSCMPDGIRSYFYHKQCPQNETMACGCQIVTSDPVVSDLDRMNRWLVYGNLREHANGHTT